MSININLLPQRKQSPFSKEKMLAYSKIAAIAGSIIVVSLSLLLFILSKNEALIEIKQQEDDTLAKLSLLHTKTAKDLIVLERVSKIMLIIKQRNEFDSILKTIQQQMTPDVEVASFALDKKTLQLTLRSPSITSLTNVLDKLISLMQNKKLLKQVTVQGVVSDEKAGNYSIVIQGDLL